MLITQGLLEVGDTVKTVNPLTTHKFVITRVTKTLAKSKRESDGHEYTFKRQISFDMSHPRIPYSRTQYFVEREEK